MEVIIYFDIMTNDGYEIGVVVTAMLSGKRIEATFHHDVEDNRECLVSNIQFFNDEGEQFSGSEKLKEIVYEHVDDNDRKIYEKAEKGVSEIDLDDLTSDKNYTDII